MAYGSGTSARNMGIWAWQQADDAKKAGQGLIDAAQSSALTSLGRNFDLARGDLNTQYTGAIDRLNPWAEAGKGALLTYQGSLGLGSAADRDAAVAAFREAPGTRYAIDTASDSIARKASALGTLGSGNTMTAIADRAQNIADQGYKDWQGQVKGVSDTGLAASGTQAGLQGQLGNSLATLGQNRGKTEADLYQGFAGMGVGNLWNGVSTGINAVTNAAKSARDNVNSGMSLGLNAIGSGLNLLSLPMGGGSTLGGSLLRLGRS